MHQEKTLNVFVISQISKRNAFNSLFQILEVILPVKYLKVWCTLSMFVDFIYLVTQSWIYTKLKLPCQHHNSSFLSAYLKSYYSCKSRSAALKMLFAKGLSEIVMSLKLIPQKVFSDPSSHQAAGYILASNFSFWNGLLGKVCTPSDQITWKMIPWKALRYLIYIVSEAQILGY